MTIPEKYRKPLIIAAFLHAALLFVLIFNFAPTMFRMPPSSAPMKTMHATAVSEASVQAEVHEAEQNPDIQKMEHQQKVEQQEKLARQEKIEKAEKIQKIEKQKALVLQENKMALLKTQQIEKVKQEKIKKRAEKAEKLKQQKLAQAKLKKQKVLALKKQQQMKQKKLIAEQNKLQQEMMQQQMNSEQKNISAVVSQAQQGAIDKYKAAILSAIQSNWRIDQVNSKLKCVYSVQLAPDGTVLSLKLVQSSGDSALDQSAQQAITLASPLPVPHDPTLFGHFRQLVLTLSPQGILGSVSSASG